MIHFHSEDIDFKANQVQKTKNWIRNIIQEEGFILGEVNYIFCSDEYLHQINLEYLNHDTFTDIITFDNSDEDSQIEGDIFISIERVQENAQVFQGSFEQELRRVLAHGVLHLCGYLDKKPDDEKRMREKENYYINLFN